MPVKTDNFFLLIFRAMRNRRVPIALCIASHNMILAALALVVYSCVMGLQFKQAMHEQADALGESLTTQTATSATELLVSNDILSLNVLLYKLTKNPLVASGVIYSADNQIVAKAGQRSKNGLLGEAEGLYQSNITFQGVKIGQLRINLDMQQFQRSITTSLQSMGILSAILLVLVLTLSLRMGRYISTPLMQLHIWLRDIDEHTPATDRQDEIGDLARQLYASLIPRPIVPKINPEPEYDDIDYDDEPEFEVPNLRVSGFDASAPVVGLKPATRQTIKPPPVKNTELQHSAVLAVQLGAQDQLCRLPRARLTELLEHYRDCLDRAASLYQSELYTLNDGSTLMLFHSEDSGEDYLTNAICCGELLRTLGHTLQIEVADSDVALQLQLGLMVGDNLFGVSQIDLLLTKIAQDALALSQHSCNLLLVERKISEDPLIRQRARILPIASPEGASFVERLIEPCPSMLERQLALMHETRAKL